MKNARLNIQLCTEVIKTLHYYAAFKHPLKIEELHYNSTQKCSIQEMQTVVDRLLEKKEIFCSDGYYSTAENINEQISRREKGETGAQKAFPSAKRYGRFIFLFPYVRFVGISGSLSKGYFDKKSDFDFFIISSRNRLWICRSILHFFKKMSFLLGLQHKFCMNYFVDEDYREIEEKNLYTAIELSSLCPIAGESQFYKLMKENLWRKDFLPNNYLAFFFTDKIDNPVFFPKKVMEFLLNPFGDFLNQYLMELTDKKWREKWKKKNYPMEEYELAFKTTLHHSKNHPANYQKKMLQRLETIQKPEL